MLQAAARRAGSDRFSFFMTASPEQSRDTMVPAHYRALAGVEECLKDGIDVRGYVHWSLLDNFEWSFGYRPKFGLVAVNRETQERIVKPSARFLGEIARRNGP